MRRVRHREYLVWMEKFRNDWNEPSRTDYYLMQIAALQMKSKRCSLDRLKVPFKFEKKSQPSLKMSAEAATALAKARWKMRIEASRE